MVQVAKSGHTRQVAGLQESAISAAPRGLITGKNKSSDVTSNSLTLTLLLGLPFKHQESKIKH